MIGNRITAAIEEALEQLLKEGGRERPAQLKVALEHPVSLEHGDYSCGVAMPLARTLRRAPLQLANELREKLLNIPDLGAVVSRIEAVPPGYLNFFLDWPKWAVRQAEAGRAAEVKGRAEKVVIEHTSINPNKSAHIGHLRNSCIGDTLARMLAGEGYQVEVHNYIDDLGNQLADTVVGILHTETERPHVRFGDFCWETYARVNRAYKENPGLLQERTKVLKGLEEGHSSIAWLGLLTAERIVREHVEEMKQFGIAYDVLVWESGIVREGFWSSAFDLLRNTPVFERVASGKLQGCWVLRQAALDGGEADEDGDYQADKVLVRSNGILTYTAKDIAYHLWKFGLLGQDFRYRKFADRLWTTHPGGAKKKFGHADRVINVIDQRQHYPQEVVKQALRALGYAEQADRLSHVGYGVVSLSPDTAKGLGIDTSDGKHAYAMSGRQGIGIKIAELLDRMEQTIDRKRSRKAGLSSRAIAAASIRYYLLRFYLQTEIVFDLEQATEISGNTGVYLLYAYARACSVIDKAGAEAAPPPEAAAFDELEQQERSLLRELAYWPDAKRNAAKELAPNQLCAYVHGLSSKFNHFYASCPVLKADRSRRDFRLWLTGRYRDAMREALGLLGLPAPRRM
ncbi:arginine--tRNA ligase [Paenibacillus arenilitoris]|uniref:Arginine--tRNA ligase n=1 Tax=Paenibacillus arenilitoris TaxID=2772299 RepID=A0A927CN92_9BACL|nr:arginine--tRNA ligase [Paenibacillus arenilitoris]MBD2871198.1 arginine--tRNA ligase [Paenibacillus arenilitoris]